MPRYIRQDGEAISISEVPFHGHDAEHVSFSDSGLVIVAGVNDVQEALSIVDAALENRPRTAGIHLTNVADVSPGSILVVQITFPINRFTSPPAVTAAANNSILSCHPRSVTTEGCEVRLRNDSGNNQGPIDLYITAIQTG